MFEHAQPLRLDLRHYETVAAIVDHGTMTAAADWLSVTQSALSHRLAEAERRLGVTLFSRSPDRRLHPTQHGRAVHQAAQRALLELRRVEAGVVGRNAGVQTTVRIGVGSYDCYHWFPGFLTDLQASRPEIELDLVFVGDDPMPGLANRSVDLVLALGKPSGDVTMTPIFDDELVLAVAPSHPLARRASIEPIDLSSETYLTYSMTPSPGFEYDRFIRPSGEPPRIIRVITQTSAILELVAAGVGVAIMSQWAIHDAVTSGRVATVQCGDAGLPIAWHAAHRRGDLVAADIGQRIGAALSK